MGISPEENLSRAEALGVYPVWLFYVGSPSRIEQKDFWIQAGPA